MTRQDFYDARVAECRRGFDNEFHWRNWWRRWLGLIGGLPEHLQAQLRLEWEQATWAGYAQPKGQAAPGGQEK